MLTIFPLVLTRGPRKRWAMPSRQKLPGACGQIGQPVGPAGRANFLCALVLPFSVNITATALEAALSAQCSILSLSCTSGMTRRKVYPC